MIKEIIKKTRSFRRFDQSYGIERNTLVELIELARLSASPTNIQSLKYFISCDTETNKKIFNTLKWASGLPEWGGPKEGEKPTAYIVMLGDNSLIPEGKRNYFEIEVGIQGQSIRIGATEKGLGSCPIAAINRAQLAEELKIDLKFNIELVIAIGKPAEIVELIEIQDNKTMYYRDSQGIHYVPKRSINELIIN